MIENVNCDQKDELKGAIEKIISRSKKLTVDSDPDNFIIDLANNNFYGHPCFCCNSRKVCSRIVMQELKKIN